MKIAELFEQEYSTEDLKEIAKDSEKAYRYAKEVIKGPWPAGEAAIATSAQWSLRYVYNVLKRKPFKAGEAAIAKEAQYSYEYAKDVLKGPWPAGEAAIAKDGWYSLGYARSVIGGPFPAGEAAIVKDKVWKSHYVKFLESVSVNIDTLLLDLIQQRLDDGEKIYLDFMEGELVQKGLIIKIFKNIVYAADTDLGVWFVQEDVDEHFTLRKIANKLVVQKV